MQTSALSVLSGMCCTFSAESGVAKARIRSKSLDLLRMVISYPTITRGSTRKDS